MAMFSVQDLVERLGEELSQTRMWDLPFLNPSAVRALLARDQWEQRLGALAQQQRRYTCSEILEMSRESMARLCQQEPEEGVAALHLPFSLPLSVSRRGFYPAGAAVLPGRAVLYLRAAGVPGLGELPQSP